MNLVDKVAIVTGAGRGIRKAIAIALAREGANVIVNDINIQIAEAVVFLVSDKAKFITGEVLDVNGGYLID
ncbi:MAG: hypothetical protein A2163_04745 [Actinobacteria bacterium RBG_13_35_12]|nr:MAG: hypothetical protein A2163_04745 [Actinobacteria bacterium RBG_13_35_12]